MDIDESIYVCGNSTARLQANCQHDNTRQASPSASLNVSVAWANIYKLLDNISGGTPTNRLGFPLDYTLIVLHKLLC